MPPRAGHSAGERDRRVTIQQMAEIPTDSGFPVEGWTALADVYASKEDIGGQERLMAGQLSAPFETRWGLEYRPDMDPDTIDVPKVRRLVYEGRTHDITAAAMIGRKEGVELLTLARKG